jgi:hypothetical protein
MLKGRLKLTSVLTEVDAGGAENSFEVTVAELIAGHPDCPNDWAVEYDEFTKEFVGEFPEWFIRDTVPDYAESQEGWSFTFKEVCG